MSWKRFLLPSPVDIVFLLVLFAVPLVRGYAVLNTDGDLGRHIRVGDTILAEKALLPADRFSSTMAGREFVPYEWLSEVAFAAAHKAAGLDGVLVLTGLVLASVYAAVALFLQRAGTSHLTAFSIAIVAAVVGAVHWLARPHIFTLLGAIATLWLLERGSRRAPWALFALFAVWANLHGGFLYGLVLIALYVTGDLLELTSAADPGRARADLRRHAWSLVGASAGMLLNPSGARLLGHVTGYLGKNYLLDSTAEYQSPDFHLLYGRIFLAVLCGTIALLALAAHRPTFPRLLTILANTAFALTSLRNIPLFGVVALPLLALHLSERPSFRLWPSGLEATFREAGAQAAVGVWSFLGIVALTASAFGGKLSGGFDPSVFPIEAIARARAAKLPGNLFNEFAWGGYVLYAWPEQRVFIDGQTDFYGERLTREYADLRAARGEWEARLNERAINLIVLPPDAPLLARLRHASGWRVWYADRTATVLTRERSAPPW